MKHEVTSYNTKKTLAEALKRAMKNKPFCKITVSEIVKDCGLNRKTFYYHFMDIYDLLKWMFEEEAIGVVSHFDLVEDYEKAIHFAMDYVEANDYIISCAYDSIGLEQMKRFFYKDFKGLVARTIDKAEEKIPVKLDPAFKDFAARFYTEALSGMLMEWALDKENRDRDKTIYYLCAMIQTALKQIHQVNPSYPELYVQ